MIMYQTFPVSYDLCYALLIHILVLTQVNKFKYPGSEVTNNGLDAELDTGRLNGSKVFRGLRKWV